jgi:fission process protein 1
MPWWSKSQDPPPEVPKAPTNEPDKKLFNPDKLPNKEKLPKGLQNIVDKAHEDESFFDKVVDG